MSEDDLTELTRPSLQSFVIEGGEDSEQSVEAVVPDQYEVIQILGQGGMGIVYKARNRFSRKVVAIKLLQKGANEVTLQRFQREAQATCALEHPNIVQTYDFGFVQDFPYLVMEYVDGETLEHRLAREKVLSTDAALPVFKQIAAGVASAHANSIVHRDLKPSNVIFQNLDGREIAKIFDFGIAKLDATSLTLTQTGEVFGTPLYMSPEQLKGAKVDSRSDVYSLGALMYQVLTGVLPHVGDTAFSTMYKKLNEQPQSFATRKIEVPVAVERIVFKCLELDPINRYRNAAEVLAELERYEDSGLIRRAVSSITIPKPDKKSAKVLLFLLGALICIPLAAIAGAEIYRNVQHLDRERKLTDLISRSNYAYESGDIKTAWSNAKEAAVIAFSASEVDNNKQRKISILEREAACANKSFDVFSELRYINQLIAFSATLGGEIETIKYQVRRLTLMDVLSTQATELIKSAVDSQSRISIAEKQDNMRKACTYLQAEMDCLSPANEPDSGVRKKIVWMIGPFLTALSYLQDPDVVKKYCKQVDDLLPCVDQASKAHAYYNFANYWFDRSRREIKLNGSGAAQSQAEALKYYQDAIAFSATPSHVYAISAMEGEAHIASDQHRFGDAERILGEELNIIFNAQKSSNDQYLAEHRRAVSQLLEELKTRVN